MSPARRTGSRLLAWRRRKLLSRVKLPAVRAAHTFIVAGLALTALVGCGIGAEGIDPPDNRIYFPSVLTVDGTSRWLYVVNSNSDLKFNRGTVVAVDLARVAQDRSAKVAADWPICPAPRYVPKTQPTLNCCRDLLDQRVLNCDERAYVYGPATVRMGSFGASVAKQPFVQVAEGQPSGQRQVERLFVAVRSDPSITFIDAWVDADGPHFRCSGDFNATPPPNGVQHQECQDSWKVKAGNRNGQKLLFPEEPFDVAIDPALGVLYTAHLSVGVSVIDACAPQLGRVPSLRWVERALFPGTPGQGVTGVSLAVPGDPSAPVYATSRTVSQVASLVLRGATAGDCPATATEAGVPRDLAVVPSNAFNSTTFHPGGNDVRAFLVEPGGRSGYLLHRNSPRGPAAIVRVDLRPDPRGVPGFRPVDTVEVCSGPTQMVAHDAGRGLRLFVTCFDAGQVYVVDPGSLSVEAIIDAGRGPTRMTFDRAQPNVAYLAGFADNNVSVIDLNINSSTEYRVVQRIGFPRQATSK